MHLLSIKLYQIIKYKDFTTLDHIVLHSLLVSKGSLLNYSITLPRLCWALEGRKWFKLSPNFTTQPACTSSARAVGERLGSEGAWSRDQNINVEKGEFIDLRLLLRDIGFNSLLKIPRDGANSWREWCSGLIGDPQNIHLCLNPRDLWMWSYLKKGLCRSNLVKDFKMRSPWIL